MTEAHGAHERKHPYHLVDPSPWPFVGAFSALVLTGGAVMYMHDAGPWVLIIGFLMVVGTMVGWWRDVVREATFQDHHTPVVQLHLRYGMALFIASEVMFFAAFFWAFFNASLFPLPAIDSMWPPPGIETFNPFELPFLNTLVLLTSGFTVTWAHHDIREAKWGHARLMLGLTILLGILFTCLQAFEYSHAPFAFTDGIYPSP